MTQEIIITRLIEKAGSVSDLANKTDTEIAQISKWRRELYGINLKKLLDMCEKLNINLKDIL